MLSLFGGKTRSAARLVRRRRRRRSTVQRGRVSFFSLLRSGKNLSSILEFTGETVGEVKAVVDMHQRKADMAKHSDVFIALPEALRNKFHLKILAGHPESNEQSKPVSRLSQGLADSLANLPLCLVLGGEGSGLSAKTRQVLVVPQCHFCYFKSLQTLRCI
ncbi:hypothetical protein ACSBR1_026134 [Camellia fascicularis]